ncbi:rhomboid family intramembrane serine protease [Myxococcota bacterium]|nr:rhomboid family intramembrane serine protease [Myxococcota bacterium]MCZ7619362.1 rhomboid family intramembrane serine protease [Myxococcota bacterium]
MFPIRDENPQVLTPLVTYVLIATNVITWITIQGLGSEEALIRSVCDLGLIPGELLGRAAPGSAFPMGSYSCVVDAEPSWGTTLSHMFLHGGWFHLLGNMWFLWIFGDNVEDSMGHVRFAVFYILCGLSAAALQMATQPNSIVPMVGASGAIGGVMGAYVMLYPRVRVDMLMILGFYVTTVSVPAIFMLGYWFLIQLIGGASSLGQDDGGGVAFWAHVGGFVAGGLLVLLFRKPALMARHPYHGWKPASR